MTTPRSQGSETASTTQTQTNAGQTRLIPSKTGAFSSHLHDIALPCFDSQTTNLILGSNAPRCRAGCATATVVCSPHRPEPIVKGLGVCAVCAYRVKCSGAFPVRLLHFTIEDMGAQFCPWRIHTRMRVQPYTIRSRRSIVRVPLAAWKPDAEDRHPHA